ncbi:MAG: Lrp/AsnC family transcriptional regulator [Woeseiaceae bacterium]
MIDMNYDLIGLNMQESITLDKFDIAILHALDQDARIPWVELAQRVSLSASACQRRSQALQAAGIIERYAIHVDSTALGFDVEAFVAVNIERQNMDFAKQFRDTMLALPEIQSCYMLSGAIDFMLRVVARDLREYGQFIQREILNLPGVKDASSSIVLEQIKRGRGVPLVAT